MKQLRTICFLFACLGLLSFASCNDDNDRGDFCDDSPIAEATIEENIIISATEYENAPVDRYDIECLKIEGDRLTIHVSASGCDGNTWDVKLITPGGYEKPIPPQRGLKLSLNNRELCAAIVEKKLSFNIKDLRIPGSNSVLLYIEDSGKTILYEY